MGGTEFNEGSNSSQYWSPTNGAGGGSALGYIPEKVWNESGSAGGSGLWASGGGTSLVYAQPGFQQGVSGTGAANGMRALPDVAMTAAGHDGYIIAENGSFWVIAGTSAASPSLAGVMALVVQSQGGNGQGNANSTLYSLLNAATSPFHATPSGDNSVPGVHGFTASGASFNLATGLGSVDGAQLVAAWGKGSGTGGGGGNTNQDFTLTASSSGGTLLVGKTASFTLSVTETSKTKNKISLAVSSPQGVNVTVRPGLILPGTPATVTVAVTSAAAAGAQTITITGSDASGSQAVSYALTVVPLPTLSLTAAASSAQVVQGGTATLGFSVATGGSFSGSVSLAIGGLPAGVSAQWSVNPVSPSSSASSTQDTLTLTASAAAKVASASILVTATGNGLTSTQRIGVQVLQAPGVQMAVSPGGLVMRSMATATATVTATPLGGVTIPVNAAGASLGLVSGLPGGITATTSAPAVSATGAVTWTLTLTGSASVVASVGTLNLAAQVTDASSGAVYATTGKLALTVQLRPPTLVAAAASGTVPVVQGASGADVFTFTSGGSFHGTVSLSVSGLPSGVTAAWSSNPVTLNGGSGSSILTLSATAAAKPGLTNIVVTASGDGLTVVQRVGVQVQYAPGLTLSLTPATLTMRHTASGAVVVTVTPVGGLSVPVTLSTGSLPNGVTAVFSPASINAPGSGSSTLTLTGSSAARAGSSKLTITANGGNTSSVGYTATGVLTLNLQ